METRRGIERLAASVIAAVIAIAVGAACTGTPTVMERSVVPSSEGSPSATTSPTVQPVTDYTSFIEALETAGFDIRQGDRTGGDGPFSLTEPGRSVYIDGVRVATYAYPSEEALDRFRSGVTDHGYGVPVGEAPGVAHVDWVDPPHFYAAGTLLVLYVGEEQHTLEALDLLIGPQFAGAKV
jgi:hypothetical protein